MERRTGTRAAYDDVYRGDGGAPAWLIGAVKVTHWIDIAVLAGTPDHYQVCARTASGLASRPTNERLIEIPGPGPAAGP